MGSYGLIVAGVFVFVVVTVPGVLFGLFSGSRCCCVFWLVPGSWVVFLVGVGRIVVWLSDVAALCGEGWGCF